MPLRINKLGVSGVTFPRSAWRYFLLFQSWPQFLSWTSFVVAINVLINSLLEIVNSHTLPVEGVLIGTILGSFCSLIMVFPTQFIISSDSDNQVIELTSEIEKLGYVLVEAKSDVITYQQKLPRWLRWDEGNVEIKRASDCLIVKGPLVILKKVRHALLQHIIA